MFMDYVMSKHKPENRIAADIKRFPAGTAPILG